MEVVRGLADSAGVDRDRWRDLAETGVFSLRLPEEDGGVGLGMTEAVLVFEELGRALVPGPVIGSHLAAGPVRGAATGEQVVGGIERDDDPLLVEHLDALDCLVVLDEDGVWAVDASEVEGEPVARPLDPLTPLHLVPSLPQGDPVASPDVAAQWRREGAVLAAAVLLGIAGRTVEIGTAYAREREQFGKPIGSFQAVKHLLADMLTRAEVARAAVYAAGVTLDDPSVGDPDRAARVAKVSAGQAAVANGKSCIQVHGGMGFTWEVDAHLFLKRAWVLDTVFGDVADHAEAIAATL
jgi:alkylation response protein AidB-like acyl-CoA dehydrogenase